jgi:hypothetical protein
VTAASDRAEGRVAGITRLPARGVGVVLGALVGALRRVRSPRPIHPVGLVLEGSIEPSPARSGERSGIDWIDETPSGRVEARLSRGIGVPVPVPDIWGLAVRQRRGASDPDGGPVSGDVLLATVAGLGVPGRFLPIVRLSPWGAPFATVMPYRSADGPVVVAARTVSGAPASATTAGQARELGRRPWVLQLLWATPRGRWRVFATLELTAPDGAVVDRPDVRFDPVLRPPTGARTYGWTRVLREPSYRAARRP